MGDAIAILTHAATVAKEIEEEILRTGAWHDVEVWGWTDVCRTLRENVRFGGQFFQPAPLGEDHVRTCSCALVCRWVSGGPRWYFALVQIEECCPFAWMHFG